MTLTHLAALALLLASLADTVTTWRFLASGRGREANPVVRWLIEHTGRAWPVIKTLPILPALWAAWHYSHDMRLALVLGGLAVVYGLVAWRNGRL
ncbi:DUF5658 family protein [Halomonas organivorans]